MTVEKKPDLDSSNVSRRKFLKRSVRAVGSER